MAVGLVALLASAASAVEPFTEEAAARGLLYVMQDWPQATGYLGFGVAFADLDADGDADVVILGAADGHVGVFENDGTGNFTDRSAGSGLPLLEEPTGVAAGDVDGDGDLDLYLTQVGNHVDPPNPPELKPNILAINEGSLTFTDASVAAGVDDLGAGQSASFGDFDGDGWLDLYVANYNGIVQGTDDLDNVLYRNLGNGTFEDVSVAQTVDDGGYGFQAVWFDYDRDGDVDLYLSNDRALLRPFRGNQLWRNDGGQLVNVSVGSGADVHIDSMGIACGDFDGNRWPDLYVTNIPGAGNGLNPLLLNQGNGTFVDSNIEAGVEHFISSWGSIFFDFDNDGYQDLFVNNMFQRNSLYDCDADFPCQEIGAAAAVGGRFGSDDPSFSSAVADVDLDGDLDLAVNSLSGNVELFINHEGEARNWVRYRMVGQGANLLAVGGSVDTRVGSSWQLREVLAGGNGYKGQNELVLHVGLDGATSVDEAVVVWPGGGAMRTLTDLPAERTWTLYPPERLGDADGDGTVDIADFFVFAGCFEIPLEPGCEVMDFDGDSAVLLVDFDAFLAVLDGGAADCNGNGVPDLLEILLGQAADVDQNGVPDECLFRDGFESGDTSAWSNSTG